MLSDLTKKELIEKILDMSERLDKLSLVVVKDNEKIAQQRVLTDELVSYLTGFMLDLECICPSDGKGNCLKCCITQAIAKAEASNEV